MPKNSDTVRALYEALGTGNIPAALGLFDANIEWNEAENFLYADGNPYVGVQSVLTGVFARLGGDWDAFSATPAEIHDAGDTVIVFGRYRGVYKATGNKVDAQFVHAFTVKDGKIAKFQQYTDTAQFRDAAGRSDSAKA